MPLMLTCKCGHAAELPERSGRYTCSKCAARIALNHFSGPGAWAKWQLFVIASGRARADAENGESARVEMRG